MFSRRWIINYVLVILICLFTYIGNRYQVEPGYQTENRILPFDADQIESIKIETASGSISLRARNTQWSIEKPIAWPANNTNIKHLLDITRLETESRLDADDVDLAALGLRFPKASLQLNDRLITFGASNNIGGRRYLLIDSTVYLVPDNHLPFITQGLTGFVDRRLLPQSSGLKSLRLPGWQFVLDEQGAWQLVDNSVATTGNAADLVKNWQGLEATAVKRFESNTTPRQKFSAIFDNGEQQEFFLMSIDPEIIIANPGIGMQYHFGADLYYQLISLRIDENSG